MFEDVAQSYDIMNDAMSIGIHRLWKDIFIERLGPTHGTQLLDMAGGTGDITFRYLKYLQKQPNPLGKQSYVTVSDINQHMLNVGAERAKNLGLTQDKLANISINWKCANAEELPFEDNTYNAYTIAFGIRNCTHIDKVHTYILYIDLTKSNICNIMNLIHSFLGFKRSLPCSSARRTIFMLRIQSFRKRCHAVVI